MKILIPKSQKRIQQHAVLFDTTLPFRPRTEQRRDLYKRREKHAKRDHSTWH
jgi:hypothetical protein